MRPRSLAPILIALGLLAGCTEQPTAPGQPVPTSLPAFAILDGAHGGDPAFYFLPPMVPAPSYSGTFDATQSPVVTICELAGTTCGTTVASFSGTQVKVDLEAEAYVAIWKTKGAGLDPTKTYRIQALVGATVLGYADVVVLLNGSQIRTVDKNQFVSVINGGVLQIRFRIEAGAPPPPPGVWQNGDLVTYGQNVWGETNTVAGQLLLAYFDPVYFSVGGVLEVGGTFTMTFQSAGAVQNYQPSAGTPGPLNANLIDPTSSASGQFGGEVVALKLNIDFSDAGHISGTANIPFGNLTLCGFGSTLASLNGTSVRSFLATANVALGGDATAVPIGDLNLIAINLNASFESGSVSLFAQDHLVNGACPGGWQNGDLVTYNQESWGGDPTSSAAAALLVAQFNARYPTGVVVGYSSGFLMAFTSAAAILNYLPQSGAAAPLNSDLLDPSSSASGVFGGFVLALQLDVDFSDSGHISGTSGLRFGNLRLCGLTTTPAYNGMTVREFLGAMNTALGAGPAAHSYGDMAILTNEVSSAFEGGAVSPFAQQHLVNGTCPGGWQTGALVTHMQGDWGDATTTAGVLLNNSFNALYGALGYVEAGIPGAAGFSMLFTSAGAAFTYQPASGTPAALNADLIDPTSTASGIFGGEVLALRFNIDLSDADFLSGTTTIDIGNLTLCGLAQSGLNGMTVRAFQDVANTALGGGSTPYAIGDLNGIASNINASFSNGAVSLFAQANLVNGPCP